MSALTSKEATAILISVMLLLLSLRNVSVFGIYPVHIITTFFILVCGYYAKEAGAKAGKKFLFTTTTNALLLNDETIQFGGLLSGVFSGFGRIASVVAFAFTGIAVGALAYDDFESYNIIIETLVASIVFIIISFQFDDKIKSVLRPSVTSEGFLSFA